MRSGIALWLVARGVEARHSRKWPRAYARGSNAVASSGIGAAAAVRPGLVAFSFSPRAAGGPWKQSWSALAQLQQYGQKTQ